MTFTIRGVEYYYANVRDELGAAYRFLSQLAEPGARPAGAFYLLSSERPGPGTSHARS